MKSSLKPDDCMPDDYPRRAKTHAVKPIEARATDQRQVKAYKMWSNAAYLDVNPQIDDRHLNVYREHPVFPATKEAYEQMVRQIERAYLDAFIMQAITTIYEPLYLSRRRD